MRLGTFWEFVPKVAPPPMQKKKVLGIRNTQPLPFGEDSQKSMSFFGCLPFVFTGRLHTPAPGKMSKKNHCCITLPNIPRKTHGYMPHDFGKWRVGLGKPPPPPPEKKGFPFTFYILLYILHLSFGINILQFKI